MEGRDYDRAAPLLRQETTRLLQGGAVFLDIARGQKNAPSDEREHYESVDSLAREIRAYAAELFQGDLSRERMDLVASQIEEVDFTDSLNEQLHHIAARVKGEKFHPSGKVLSWVSKGSATPEVSMITRSGFTDS